MVGVRSDESEGLKRTARLRQLRDDHIAEPRAELVLKYELTMKHRILARGEALRPATLTALL